MRNHTAEQIAFDMWGEPVGELDARLEDATLEDACDVARRQSDALGMIVYKLTGKHNQWAKCAPDCRGECYCVFNTNGPYQQQVATAAKASDCKHAQVWDMGATSGGPTGWLHWVECRACREGAVGNTLDHAKRVLRKQVAACECVGSTHPIEYCNSALR